MNDNEQRDELAQIIRANQRSWVTDSEHRDPAAEQAEAILIVGYRQHVKVAMPADLDELPIGSVIVDSGGLAWEKHDAGEAVVWHAAMSGMASRTSAALDDADRLPATVIHEPTTEATP